MLTVCAVAVGLAATVSELTQFDVDAAAAGDARECVVETTVDGQRSDLRIRVLTAKEFENGFLSVNDVGDERAADHLAAYYSRNRRAIFLPPNFDPGNVMDRSVLLHELVHHVQQAAGSDMRLPALEAEAYEAQAAYLRDQGDEAAAALVVAMMHLKNGGEYGSAP